MHFWGIIYYYSSYVGGTIITHTLQVKSVRFRET